ncbi:hypothetical protein [Actinokineospora bangkokensis]|uniref:Uncharacterized protein n=1 Tax=Actinokineospora bangkokensis TaxID=1193682 RepID=A0A1Q9LU49_9PSEU|nr:hypothetical protein [Actinokineospora bangkokensis]OLR95550.1 hypothetical protein BJP25_00190 [Actinokineospora bangkokensis]
MFALPSKAVRRRRALCTAAAIDRLVDDRVAGVRGLPEADRRRHAEHLAELVALAQAYRHFGKGWIGKRELDRRSAAATRRLTALRLAVPSAAHLTDGD